MNVIISNKNKEMLQSLPIDIIKSLEGEFTAEELVNQFQNFFYQRMILDITALKNHDDFKTLQTLSISLDMDKLILVLDDSEESGSSEYLSKLISMGIYNFTKNAEGIMYLYNNPNSYRDVAHIHQLEASSYSETVYTEVKGVKIIGIKDVNQGAGATTLVHMMTKALNGTYKVLGVEVDKTDFMFFQNKNLISTTSANIGNILAKNNANDVIFVDINNSVAAEGLCQDIIYLLDPSTIKLNKFMFANAKALAGLKNKKVILNKSLLSSKDVLDFEYEAKIKVFYNLPPLDDREVGSHALNMFLVRLGFDKMGGNSEQEKKRKILGIFNI